MTDTTKLKTLRELVERRRKFKLQKENFTKEISSKIDLTQKEIDKIIMGEDEIEGQGDITEFIEEQGKKAKKGK